MSKAASTIVLTTFIGVHDKEDMATLGSFLTALSEADLEKLGAHGDGKIKPHGRDYVAVFGSCILGRFSPEHPIRRQTKCPSCESKTWSMSVTAEYCNAQCWNEIHGDVA